MRKFTLSLIKDGFSIRFLLTSIKEPKCGLKVIFILEYIYNNILNSNTTFDSSSNNISAIIFAFYNTKVCPTIDILGSL